MQAVRLSTAAVIVIVAGWGASLGAQQKPAPPKPNFTGRWVIVSPTKAAGQEQLVTLDGNTLTFEIGARKQTYQLDGVERRMPQPSGRDITIMATAKWDGDRIVIVTIINYNGMRTEGKDVWSIHPQGRVVIDYTETGSPPSKAVFTRKGKTNAL